MWQSPGWPFDTIGVNESVKWSAKKNASGIYERETPSWSGVPHLWEYAKTNDNASIAGTVYGISCNTSAYTLKTVQPGDLIQLHETSASQPWHHTVVVVSNDGSGNLSGIKVCAHSNDRVNYGLNNYFPKFDDYRIIHINNYITSY